MKDSILSLHNISITAGNTLLLSGIKLGVRAGELTALTGPSGSGKSTLLRAVAGLIDINAGDIRYKNNSRASFGWTHYRRNVILVEQQPALFDTTVEINLQRPFQYRVSNNKIYPADRARTLLQRLAIEPDRLFQNAGELSVGQKQRVCLVRALLLEPEILLLDEPTSALDEDAASLVESLIREETQRGLGALIVMHDHEQAERWCDWSFDIGKFIMNSRK